MEKAFLYVGHYIDINGNYILKIGTTNNLERRKQEHEYHYKHAESCSMPQNGEFIYDWFLPLSKYNTLRYEDKNRSLWIVKNIGIYIRNDRFLLHEIPETIEVKIQKTYIIHLQQTNKRSYNTMIKKDIVISCYAAIAQAFRGEKVQNGISLEQARDCIKDVNDALEERLNAEINQFKTLGGKAKIYAIMNIGSICNRIENNSKIISILEGREPESQKELDLLAVHLDQEIIFIDAESNPFSKKSASSTSDIDAERQLILKYLHSKNEGSTASEIAQECNISSPQRATAILKKLVGENKVKVTKPKNKNIYFIA